MSGAAVCRANAWHAHHALMILDATGTGGRQVLGSLRVLIQQVHIAVHGQQRLSHTSV